MILKNTVFSPILIITLCLYSLTAGHIFWRNSGKHSRQEQHATDKDITSPVDTVPVKSRKSFYPPDTTDPIHLQLPKDLDHTIDFDPLTNTYFEGTKIGNDYLDAPVGYSFDEYQKMKKDQQEKDYFDKLAGISGRGSGSAKDPLEGYTTKNSIIDRLFGGSNIDIKPTGSVDVSLGFASNFTDNPTATERQRKYTRFLFQPSIDLSIAGKVGERLKINANYNTQSQFDFDQVIKIHYEGADFGEDEIVKKVEAGNVSLPLKSSLIQGSLSLFGIRTDLQFGKLKLTGLVSQQKSERKNLQVQGGSQLQTFEIPIDQYDENRHFLLSQYNKNTFDKALEHLPQINSFFSITDIEVWVTNDRQETEDVRDIVAFADLGEQKNLTTYNPFLNDTVTINHPDYTGRIELPNNDANKIYQQIAIQDSANTRPLNKTVSTLTSSPYNMVQTRDFEKVRARKLRPNVDYTYHPELGFISINTTIRSDQVVGVAYRYRYNDKIYQVGEFSHEVPVDPNNPNALFVKLLKATTQNTQVPLWGLMMKNIYSTGAYQVNPLDFRMDIFYEDPGFGQKRFLPDTDLKGVPLLRVFNLDNLNTTGDPQPDGVFDFVEGVTINSKTGRIMFPVLEPFGSRLAEKIGNKVEAEKYTYPQLYETTITRAREFPEYNRFTLKGSYKSSVSSEINLGAFNIPRGSVKVTAGGTVLTEDVDYTIDYGAGRVNIINKAYLSSGVPVNVSFEDNALFSFQQKSMMGLRADYALNKNLNLGATFMTLKERPFTQKVNFGDDPLNNKIYGADVTYGKDAPWLTRMVDKIPLIQTKEPSKVNLTAEVAYLQPGHSKFINNLSDEGGTVYIDDFEGSTSSFDLRTPTIDWVIASVPQNDAQNNNPRFPESALNDNLAYGYNRAKLMWYRAEINALNDNDRRDPYSRFVDLREVFPTKNNITGFNSGLYSFDVVYEPQKRGPYNFELPSGSAYSAGLESNGDLRKPETRWAGIQRALPNTDFEAQNYEFIEFYMLSPFLDRPGGIKNTSDGKLYINLGNVSEDIMKDSRNFFENGLPGPKDENQKVFETKWGRVPAVNQFITAFDNDPEKRAAQDVGLDGLDDDGERDFYKDYLNAINNSNLTATAKQEIETDPSNDNFKHFREYPDNEAIITKYSKYNNQQGNSKPTDSNSPYQTASSNYPDVEDINKDNSLNESESYFQYEIPIEWDGQNGIKLNKYITDVIKSNNGEDVWYRFKIPINNPSQTVGAISDFRSIRFIRMYVTDFNQETVMRFARLDLVRNQWRKAIRGVSSNDVFPGPTPIPQPELFDLNAVNYEDNSEKIPVNYVLPRGLTLERSVGAYQETFQNEQSLNISYCNFKPGGRLGIYKNTNLDMRRYKRLKMLVHASPQTRDEVIPPGDITIFIRIGSDFTDNYYEYQIPLTMSDFAKLDEYKTNQFLYSDEVWLDKNKFDFPLELLTQLKQARNSSNSPINQFYSITDPDKPDNTVGVKGNPNLGYIKGIMIGLYNKKESQGGTPHCGEVWVNELRMTGLDERGGVAAIGRADFQLADLGTLTLSGGFHSIGWGNLDQRVQERAIFSNYQYDISTNLELGKFIPGKTGIKIPFYFQYTTNVNTPQYDPYDLDIKLRDKLDNSDASIRDSLREQAVEYENITSYSFNNVRKERVGNTGKPKPWDIENFSLTYGYTTTDKTDPIIAKDEIETYKGGLDYNYTMQPLYFSPFKKTIKNDKYLKFISDFNFNLIPNTFGFNTQLNRYSSKKLYRFTDPVQSTWRTRNFLWDRNYQVNWDLTRSLKFDFNATNTSVIDELADRDLITSLPDPNYTEARNRAKIWDGIKNFGRNKNYKQTFNVNLNVPMKNFPFLEWINIRALYGGTYGWSAAALNVDTLGNVIQNSQMRQVNADFNFDRLYDKWDYLKKIQRAKTTAKKDPKSNQPQKPTPDKNQPQTDDPAKDGKLTKEERKAKEKKERQEKRDKREPTLAERIIIRPLLSIRRARLTYSENFNSMIPGYMPGTTLFGMDKFNAPGLAYAAGWQPDSKWFDRAVRADDPWITDNIFQNQLVTKGRNQNIDAKVNLEPFNDFKVDLNANKTYSETYTELFKVKDIGGDFRHMSPREVGSYTISYFTLGTMFNDMDEVFKKFESNRQIISGRLGTGTHPKDTGYTAGFGRIQQQVLTPAFLAAYTGNDPMVQKLDLFQTIPRINWNVTYNGLSKLDFFQKYFSSFSLTHAYKSTMTVNNFNSSPYYDADDPDKINPVTANYYSRFELPSLVITEGLSPLLRLDVKTKNDITFNIDYKKVRNLTLSFIDNQVNETKSSDLTIGAGYQLHNVTLPFMKEFKTNRRYKRSKKNSDPNKTSQNQGGAPTGKLSQNDLTFKFDLSLRDDVSVSHFIDQNRTQISRGVQTVRISPNIEYEYNKNITLRFFYDYNLSKPKTSLQYKTVAQQGGIMIRFLLN
jgi:cell surface protein SprA